MNPVTFQQGIKPYRNDSGFTALINRSKTAGFQKCNGMKKKYVFNYSSHLRHYEAAVFALRCFDNRFWKIFKHFMKHLGLGDIDPESPAGGAKVLASPEKRGDRNFMLREIEKSIRLHHTRRVMLFTHHDCGAYGGLTKFKNDEEKEFVFHCQELAKAQKIVQEKFPKLKVKTYFIDEQGVVDTTDIS